VRGGGCPVEVMMDWIHVTDRLPPFGKNVLSCSKLAVTYFVANVSPQDGK
jgi:hypothetical protein